MEMSAAESATPKAPAAAAKLSKLQNAQLGLVHGYLVKRLPNVCCCVLMSVPSGLIRASAAVDGPARRAAPRASCCRQRWLLSVINWPSTTASIVNLIRHRLL